jgi:ferrous iron transport protein B
LPNRWPKNVATPKLDALRAQTAEMLGDDIDINIADARYGFVNQVTSATVRRKNRVRRSISDRIDRIVLNRALGIPIFLLAMYLMFLFTINIGGAFIDFFDIFTGTLLVDGLGTWLVGLGTPDWLVLLLADGLGGGVQVVATFIPVIAFLYLFLSALEDSGYMARAAFVMDRAMRAIGLPGKAFVPLIVGFGCNVPAIMATRTLEQQRDRLMTIVMAPFMSCGARLPVYVLFAAAFFPIGGQNVVFGLYLIGIAVAVLTGLIMKNTLLRGQTAPFVMELPPYHLPTVRGILLRSWERTHSFIFRAGKIIVPMVLVLNVLNAVGTDGSFGNEDSDQSVLSEIGRSITPAFAPMGMTEDNWPAAVGLFTGVLAKEAVVGTLNALYSDLAVADAAASGIEMGEEGPFSLIGGLGEAFASIPANLVDAMGTWADPLGLAVGDLSNTEGVAEEQGVSTGTFGAMAARFDGAAGAFAYLLLILLYFPCTAALAAVYRETNTHWTLFVAAWTTGIGYIVATVFYQAAIFSRSPATSAAWIAAMLGIFLAVTLVLRAQGVARGAGAPARQQA